MRRGLSRAVAVGLVLAVALAACSGDDDEAADTGDGDAGADTTTTAAAADGDVVDPYDGHVSETYDGTDAWICHPDLQVDECSDLSATELAPDGSTQPAELAVADDPPIDCFYVYPTTSADPGQNSDLDPDESENATVRVQAGPFASQCRVFAPVYRSVTLTAIGSGGFSAEYWQVAHDDVVDAWKTYISQYNEGRGVVLIGHSQGTGHLTELIGEEIVGNPDLEERLVSAILLGGEVTGFDGIPACETADQFGCVITYSSYPAAAPPIDAAIFGRASEDAGRALCVDPTDLTGDDALGDAITTVTPSLLGGVVSLGLDVDTRYVVVPDALELSCESAADHDYLSVAVAPGQDATRLADFTTETLGPAWGLHLLDANVAMGNLLEIVETQSAAFTAT